MTTDEFKDEAVYTTEEQARDRLRLVALIVLSIYSVIGLIAIVWLSAKGLTAPESLITTVSLSIGGVVGMAATK